MYNHLVLQDTDNGTILHQNHLQYWALFVLDDLYDDDGTSRHALVEQHHYATTIPRHPHHHPSTRRPLHQSNQRQLRYQTH